MSDIPAALRDGVVRRAGNRCEYCGLSQAGQEAVFHVDHVVPRVAGGPTELQRNQCQAGLPGQVEKLMS